MKKESKFKQAVFGQLRNPVLVRWLFGLSLAALLQGGMARAQGVPRIGNRLEFAGVTILLTPATQHLVQQEAELLYVNRALVTSRLERMNFYFPIIKPVLAQHSLSDDFLFLALFDPISGSDEATTEFWALNKTSLNELKTDVFVDERRHPIRSTLAVVLRLKQLHDRKPNWVSVVHRYDRLLRADTTRLWSQEPVDPKIYALNDTRDLFLIRLLASKIVLERSLSVYHPQKQMVLFPYEESRGKSLQQIATQCQVSETVVEQYNTWLKVPRVPDYEDYTVYVPTTLEHYAELKHQTSLSEENQAVLQDAGFPLLQKSTAEPGDRGGVFYQINGKKGIQAQLFDSRITLAYQGKLKVGKFQKYNDLRSDRPIVAGEIYYLQKKSKRANVPFHIVRRGQSLWAIAQQYGILLEKLIEYNDVNPEQQPAVSRILWLQKKRPANMPVEYYRGPAKPGPADPTTKSDPVLAAFKPDSAGTKPLDPNLGNPAERIVVEKAPATVPARSTLAALDSMIAMLNEPQMPLLRSSAAKMIQPVSQTEKVVPAKPAEDEPDEVSGPLIMHIAEKTDTYATVARKYNVTVQQLYVWNNLSAQKPLRPGQALLVDQSKSPTKKGLVPPVAKPSLAKPAIAKPVTTPASKPVVTNPAVATPTALPAAGSGDELIHVVQAGENMYRIGLRYKVKPEQVRQWNNLPDLTAVVGARLVIHKK
ncbi:LysM peptidoglycan-binding domain-containing protein [Larkinella terrae]|uniref:LysM peptidoglycan-binding domain-containing protein n=1 Tax=Larkinella terrae TaxID=2025311 RepID=A0A7K0EHA5_9BACT|nr:LysM peptidoglycan-binding domain-containing protein [Larkinella terrae]MRS61187.1 LysM peptidoglycan-binding domain-containing protein [Larkinella terrae]